MRVFLDTNVLASAAATRGLCADVFREVLTSHELIISRALTTELKRVLNKKFKAPQDLITGFIDLLQQGTILAKPKDTPKVKIKDEDDLIILSAAVSASTDLFVTGDKEVQSLKHIGNMKIVSPRDFWNTLTAQQRAEVDG